MFTLNKYIAKLNYIKEGCLGLYHFQEYLLYMLKSKCWNSLKVKTYHSWR